MEEKPTPCGAITPCDPVVCEPLETHTPPCCPDPIITQDYCGINLAIVDCPPAWDPANPCGCSPCFTPDPAVTGDTGVPITPEAKTLLLEMLESMRDMIGMTPYCGCEPIRSTGNDIPAQKLQKRNELMELLWIDSSGAETTDMVDPKTGLPNEPAVDKCCGLDLDNSIFLSSGLDPYAHFQDFGSGIFEGMGCFDAKDPEFARRIGLMFCCAMDRIKSAPVLVIDEK